MNRLLNRACAWSVLAAGLAGCGLPRYVPAAGDPVAHVTMYPDRGGWFCVDGQRYGLPSASEGAANGAVVPAGRRVTLGMGLTYQNGNLLTLCQPAVSVVPTPGSTLVLHSGFGAGVGRCYIEAVRADPTTETGVAVEPTVGAPAC